MKEYADQKTKYLYLALFFVLLYLSFLLIKPFILAILVSFVVAYMIYPVYIRLNSIINNRSLCSVLTLLILIIIILIPIFFIAEKIIPEASTLYHNVVNVDLGGLNNWINNYLGTELNLELYLRDATSKLLNLLLKNLSDYAMTLPVKFAMVFISMFIIYYLLKEGEIIVEGMRKYLPLKEEYKHELLERLKEVTYATVYGVIVTAIVQGIAGTIGLVIFDVKSPLLFGLLMSIAAMLPFGAALIWLPLASSKIFSGDLFNGIGLLIYGALIISLIDNIVRPMIISKKSRTHPLITILGVIGGLSLFGFVGVIIGPLILAVLISFLDFYIREYEA